MSFLYLILAFSSGMAATLQALINTKLMTSLGGPIFTSLISFSIGTFTLVVIYSLSVFRGAESLPTFGAISQTNWWMWSGGLLGALFVFTTVFLSPKIGFANLFSLLVAGQVICAVLFDHFGILGVDIHSLNWVRICGACLLVFGVYLIETH